MRLGILATWLGASLILSGCSVMAVRAHQPGFKNTRELAAVRGIYRVGEISGSVASVDRLLSEKAMPCRLTTFNMPADKSVGQYIQQALTDELDAAKKLSDKGTPITIVVNKLDSDTAGLDKGSWTLDFTYQVGSRAYNVRTTTQYESAFVATTACRNTGDALTDALSANFMALYHKMQGR